MERRLKMTTTSDNITNWKSLSDIDYFTQYIKTYLAFNAWMRARYTSTKRDRETINKIKNENNEFRRKIESLLANEDPEGEMFRSFVSSLHFQLERVEVMNDSKRISFHKVFIGENSTKESTLTRNRITYKVEILNNNNVKVEIINSNARQTFYLSQTKYNLSQLIQDEGYLRLSQNQKFELKALYEECNPWKNEDVISPNSTGIKIGQFYFIDDIDKITKAIIEILYLLRNTLFHGEVLPDKERNRVYEQAYQILKTLIQIL